MNNPSESLAHKFKLIKIGAGERNQNLPGMGGIYNSRNLQTYHYAGNNPLKYTDPTGNELVLIIAIGMWSLFGGIIVGGMYGSLTDKSNEETLLYMGAGGLIFASGGVGLATETAGLIMGSAAVMLLDMVSSKAGNDLSKFDDALMDILNDPKAMLEIGTSMAIAFGFTKGMGAKFAEKLSKNMKDFISTFGSALLLKVLKAIANGDQEELTKIMEEYPEISNAISEILTEESNNEAPSYIHNSSYMHQQTQKEQKEKAEFQD